MSCWNTGQQGWSEKQDIVTCYLWVCPGIQWGVASFFSFNSSVSGRITWHALFVLPDILIRICLLLRCVRLNATMELEHWCYLENRYCFWNNLFFIHSWTWALDARDGCFPLTVMHFLFCSHCFIIVQLVRPWDPWMLFLDMITPHICFNWLHPSARFFLSVFHSCIIVQLFGPWWLSFLSMNAPPRHAPVFSSFFLVFTIARPLKLWKNIGTLTTTFSMKTQLWFIGGQGFREDRPVFPTDTIEHGGSSGTQACLPDGHAWPGGGSSGTGLRSRQTWLNMVGWSGRQACVPDGH